MKQLVIIVLLVVAGYFAYQHFFAAPPEEAVTEEEEAPADSGSPAMEQPPPTPDSCKAAAKNLENAIYGHATGESSFAQRNTTYRKFQACLREAGFSDGQINGATAEIEERVKRFVKQDGG